MNSPRTFRAMRRSVLAAVPLALLHGTPDADRAAALDATLAVATEPAVTAPSRPMQADARPVSASGHARPASASGHARPASASGHARPASASARARAASAPAEAYRRVQALLLGHSSSHHDSRTLGPILLRAGAERGITLSYTEDPDDLNPETLADYDVVLIYANHASGTPEQMEALVDFVEGGGGLVPVHAGGGCFKDSEEYGRLVSSRFLSHGTGTFTAEIVRADHRVMEGIEPFSTWDETYVHEHLHDDRTVLMERVDAEGREPWTWARTQGEGRVVYTAYGHDERTWSHPMFQRLVTNAVLWAAGDEVRDALQSGEGAGAPAGSAAEPPLEYTDDSPTIEIPDYEPPPDAERLQVPLSPEASLAHWHVPPGFELTLFAAEPDIVNPIAAAWDERGRLWVVETVDYPNDKQPEGEGNDVIRILEDTNGDGRADRSTLFADRLSIPTGLVLSRGGAIVAEAPHLLFLADTTGDDRADVRDTIMTGWGTRDTHAGPSNLQYGFDNHIWGVVGYSGYAGEVDGTPLRFGAGVYRFRPDGSELEVVAHFTNNTFGLGFSEGFDVFGSTANNEHSVHVAIPARYYEGAPERLSPGRKKIDGHFSLHPIAAHTRQVDYQGGFTSASGHNLYTARSFPREYWNRIAFVGEPTGNLLHRAVLERDGAGFREEDGWNLLASRDEWTSPIDARVGPDGAVWILDWYAFRKQHNTPWPRPPGGLGWETGPGNSYVTPYRDSERGRIYRLAWRDAPASRRILDRDRPDDLVSALSDPNLFWRLTGQRLLVERGGVDVAPALLELLRRQRLDETGLDAGAVHALWTLHGLGLVGGNDAEVVAGVEEALSHPSAQVRGNALMVLPAGERATEAILGAGVLHDEDPAIRLAAFLALAEQPASESLGRRLHEISSDATILEDEWLPTGLFLAAMRHEEGFLEAYAEEVGAIEFARAAGRAYRGELPAETDFAGTEVDDTDWDQLFVPGTWTDTALDAFTGVVWFRREFEISSEREGAAATLVLGPIRQDGAVWVNGRPLDPDPRDPGRYLVPVDLLRAGANTLAVRVGNGRGSGGILGEEASAHLVTEGSRVDLAGDWRYRIQAEWEGGRRPDFSPGAPFAEQYLRYRNPVGDPEH